MSHWEKVQNVAVDYRRVFRLQRDCRTAFVRHQHVQFAVALQVLHFRQCHASHDDNARQVENVPLQRQ